MRISMNVTDKWQSVLDGQNKKRQRKKKKYNTCTHIYMHTNIRLQLSLLERSLAVILYINDITSRADLTDPFMGYFETFKSASKIWHLSKSVHKLSRYRTVSIVFQIIFPFSNQIYTVNSFTNFASAASRIEISHSIINFCPLNYDKSYVFYNKK
jgi:hypothetical protein